MISFVVDHILKKTKNVVHDLIILILCAVVFGVFLYFKDFAFGFTGPPKAYMGRKWLDSWNIF